MNGPHQLQLLYSLPKTDSDEHDGRRYVNDMEEKFLLHVLNITGVWGSDLWGHGLSAFTHSFVNISSSSALNYIILACLFWRHDFFQTFVCHF